MSISYRLAAASAILSSARAGDLLEPCGLDRDVKEGDLMACITMNTGAVLTVSCAHLRIVGPSTLQGICTAHIDRAIENGVMCTLRSADIDLVDYFTA